MLALAALVALSVSACAETTSGNLLGAGSTAVRTPSTSAAPTPTPTTSAPAPAPPSSSVAPPKPTAAAIKPATGPEMYPYPSKPYTAHAPAGWSLRAKGINGYALVQEKPAVSAGASGAALYAYGWPIDGSVAKTEAATLKSEEVGAKWKAVSPRTVGGHRFDSYAANDAGYQLQTAYFVPHGRLLVEFEFTWLSPVGGKLDDAARQQIEKSVLASLTFPS